MIKHARSLAAALLITATGVACSGGGSGPAPAPGSSAGAPTPTAHATASPSGSASASATPSPAHSPTSSPTATPSATPTPTPTPTVTPTPGPPTAVPLTSRLTLGTGNTCSATSECFYGQYVALPGNTTTAPQIGAPRQLAMLPNGDLIVGTGSGSPGAGTSGSSAIYIIPAADGDPLPGTPAVFATIPDTLPQGVTYSAESSLGPNGAIYVGAHTGVYAIPYTTGMHSASAGQITKIFGVRTPDIQSGCLDPSSGYCDNDDHRTTSVLADDTRGVLFVSVGSSCNACTETDPTDTRAVVMEVPLTGDSTTLNPGGNTGPPSGGTKWIAKRYRNGLALAQNPQTHNVWVGGAGQDCIEPPLPTATSPAPTPRPNCPAQPVAPNTNAYFTNGHPYEHLDPLTLNGNVSSTYAAAPDYGWPYCEENGQEYYQPGYTAYKSAGSCSSTGSTATQMLPAVEYLAYGTITGAVFYPERENATYAFGSGYKGALFFSGHGSWHEDQNGRPVTYPLVSYVTMSEGSDTPQVQASNVGYSPTAQWKSFVSNYQANTGAAIGTRVGQPVGLAVGPLGSLFVADDYGNAVYRIRYGIPPQDQTSARRRNAAPRARGL